MLFLGKTRLPLLLSRLAAEYELFAPVPSGDSHRMARSVPGLDPVFPPFRLSSSLRAFWLQPARVLATWSARGPAPGPEPKPRAIIGAKACDLRALEVLDKVLRGQDFVEPAYAAARDRHFIVSGDCTEAAATCFCTLVEGAPWPERGFDLNLSPAGEGFLVEAGSGKGDRFLLAQKDLLDEAPATLVAERDRRRAQVREQVDRQNEMVRPRSPYLQSVGKHLKTRLWGELAATCVECSACNYNCPTCYCFLLHETRDAGEVKRISVQDSCFHAGYSRMAGGGTPRLQLTERFKNHYFHKFVWFRETFGITACTGCGRCVEACMGKIDKRKCLRDLETRWIPTEVVQEL
ncbi:MAG: 4Fe-4S dicluster domain-containing protein [Planctomycetes bacterium]|nr:4Fe-4S dicluster domain-containing protein [Planctomycetota bacterium]